ncbi:MAG TPA: hypothetical protein VM409_02175 [Chloroflexia bacterium]|nr:hypothetical protein [Chloroflexia bacterium]
MNTQAARWLTTGAVVLLTLAGCGPGSSGGTTPTVPATAQASPTAALLGSVTPAARLPVVLVHGWKGSLWGNVFSGCPADYKGYVPPTPVSEAGDFNDLGNQLSKSYGFRVYYARLLSSPCYTPRVDANVPRLIETIDRAKSETGQAEVVLIAHSMGGLVARAYLEGDGYRDDVSEYFSLGSPHDGVNISANWLAILLAPHAMDVYDYLGKQEVMQDFKQGAMSRYATRRSGVRYHLIGGDLPIGSRTALGGLTYLLSGGIPGDGIAATISSTRLEGEADRLRPPEAHSDSLGHPDYFSSGSAARRCVVDALVSGRDCGVRGPLAPDANALQAAAPLCRSTEFATLLAKYDIGPHLPEALREYTSDCYGRGMSASDLVAQAVKAGLPARLLSIESSGATGFVADAGGRKSGVLPGGKVVEEIPGSRVLSLKEATYVFYPPSDVTAEIKGTAAGKATIKMVRGSDPATAEALTYDPVDIAPDVIIRIAAAKSAPLGVDTNGDGQAEVEHQPKDSSVLKPARP